MSFKLKVSDLKGCFNFGRDRNIKDLFRSRWTFLLSSLLISAAANSRIIFCALNDFWLAAASGWSASTSWALLQVREPTSDLSYVSCGQLSWRTCGQLSLSLSGPNQSARIERWNILVFTEPWQLLLPLLSLLSRLFSVLGFCGLLLSSIVLFNIWEITLVAAGFFFL